MSRLGRVFREGLPEEGTCTPQVEWLEDSVPCENFEGENIPAKGNLEYKGLNVRLRCVMGIEASVAGT